VAFALGTALGGALTGLLLAVLSGLLSPVPPAARAVTTALLVVALLATDLLSPTLRLPQRDRLIPQEVFGRGLARGLFRFGVEYGSGVRTLVPGAASYMVAGYLVLAHHPWWFTVGAAAAFGFSRSLAILQFVLLGRDGWAQFLSGHSRVLERLGSTVTAVLLLVAVLGG
jgi:hypothetical protein